jgi:hypothetical protein
MRTWLRLLSTLLAALLPLTRSGRAGAESAALIVLVRPTQTTPAVTEALTRVRGELTADGFDVAMIDAQTASDPDRTLARVGQQTSAAATLGIFIRDEASVVELWVVDRVTNKTSVRRAEAERGDDWRAPEVLARRVVELLRASLLEVLVPAPRRANETASPQTQAYHWAARALERRRSTWGIDGGAAMLGGFGGVQAAILPVARLRLSLNESFTARLTLAGLGTRPTVSAEDGTAAISQALTLLELQAIPAKSKWVRPVLSIGAGAYHVGAEGNARWPYQGVDVARWTVAADAGAGISLPISSTFEIAIEGHAMVATPYPVIRFLGRDIANTGRPSIFAVVTLVGWL